MHTSLAAILTALLCHSATEACRFKRSIKVQQANCFDGGSIIAVSII
jgi:hypothetical protein